MNRYAVSPILPLSTRGSGKSGSKFDTRWQVDVPYDGYYTLKGAADDRASVKFTQGDLTLDLTNLMDSRQRRQISLLIKYSLVRVKQILKLSFNSL